MIQHDTRRIAETQYISYRTNEASSATKRSAMPDDSETPFRRARKAAGYDKLSDFARAHGLEDIEGTLRHWDNGTREMPYAAAKQYAPLLKTTREFLMKEAPSNGSATQGQIANKPLNRMPVIHIAAPVPGDKIPVMGAAEGGADGHLIWNGEAVDYIDRPPSLASAPNGYATFIFGTSMEPRYHAGETIYVHPGKPVTPGCYVLVQIHPRNDGDPPGAFVKRFVKRTPTKLVLEQFSPPEKKEFPLKDVLAIHRIVGSGE